VFSLTEKAQQASGAALPGRLQSTPSCVEGHRTEIILLGCGSALKLRSIFAALLERFQAHHDTIPSIWVANVSTVTANFSALFAVHSLTTVSLLEGFWLCCHLVLGPLSEYTRGEMQTNPDTICYMEPTDKSR